MTTEETDLTFIRCPNCRSLIPAIATRCRMCGTQFDRKDQRDGSGENGTTEPADTSQKSRVRQRTITATPDEVEEVKRTAAAESTDPASLGITPTPPSEAVGSSPPERGAPTSYGSRPSSPSSAPSTSSGSQFRLGGQKRETTDESESPTLSRSAQSESPTPGSSPSGSSEVGRGSEGGGRGSEGRKPTNSTSLTRPPASQRDEEDEEEWLDDDDDADSGDDDDGAEGLSGDDALAPRAEGKRKRRRRRKKKGQPGTPFGESSDRPEGEAPRPSGFGAASGAMSHADARQSSGASMSPSAPHSHDVSRGDQPRGDLSRSEQGSQSGGRAGRGPSESSDAPRITPAFEPPGRSRTEPRSEPPRPSPVNEPRRSERAVPAASEHSAEEIPMAPEGDLVGWLIDYSRESRGLGIELRAGKFFVGRQKLRQNDLVLENNSLSTPHCMVTAAGPDGIVVQDLMSERGTYFRRAGAREEERVQQFVTLRHGDWLKLGEYEVMLCLVPPRSR